MKKRRKKSEKVKELKRLKKTERLKRMDTGDKNMHVSVKLIFKADVDWLSRQEVEVSEDEPLIKHNLKKSIDLTKDSPPEKIDMLLRTLIGYNDTEVDVKAEKETLIQQLCFHMEHRDLTLPGGIHFEGDGKHIFCGCCSGTETWREMADDLKEHSSPWMGHDPDVSFGEKDGICYIADTELSPRRIFVCGKTEDGKRKYIIKRNKPEEVMQDEKRTIIAYRWREFHACLERLDGEFADFVAGPLKKRMEEIAPEYAERFCEAFVRCFRREEGWRFEEEEMEKHPGRYITLG